MHSPLIFVAGVSLLACAVPVVAGGTAIEVVIKEGDVAPGTGGLVVLTVNAPFTNGNGRVGFTGSVDNGGVTDNFVWYNTGVTWRNSDALPDVVTGAESTMGIGDGGEFIYSPSVNGEDSVWISQGGGTTVFSADDVAPGLIGQFLSFASRPQMNADGTATWVSGFTNAMGGPTQGRVLYTYDGVTATPLLASGDNIMGFIIDSPSGVDFDYDFSKDGSHHIQVLLMDTGSSLNDGFIYVDGALVAREGSPTGDGDNWGTLDAVSINDAGNYVFTGDTDGNVATDEFIAYNGAIVVREGDVLDGVQLTSSAALQAVSINNGGQVAHLWTISGGDELLFLGVGPSLGTSSTLLARIGDLVDTDGDTFYDAEIVDFNASGIIGPGLDLADDGFIYFEVDLSDLDTAVEVEAIVRLDLGSCVGDLNLDGFVNTIDFLALLAAWGPNPGNPADLNNDGVVDTIDFLALLANWGSCSPV